MASSRIKVSTPKLLEAMRERRAQMEADHAKAVAAYQRNGDDYRRKVVKALRDAADRVEAGGELPDTGYKDLRIPVRFKPCDEPSLSTTNIDRLIKTLELASDDAVTLSADDAAKYLG